MEESPGYSFGAGKITTTKSCSAHIKNEDPQEPMMGSWSYEWPTSSIFSVPTISKHNSEKKLREFPVHESCSDFIGNTEHLPTFFRVKRLRFSSWLEFPKTSQRLLRISDDFPKTYERFRKSPKMFRRTLSTSEAIWKATNLACFERITTQSQH